MPELDDEMHELRAHYLAGMREARAELEAALVMQQIWLDEFDRLAAWVKVHAPELEPALRVRLQSVAARVKAVRGISTEGMRQ